ncbi:MAG: putative toxin-antitoxin system toxin component, PIN family [Elusimicrobia bacterium RIFCSPLOWO2_02_FULL_39_32]|nr:MAG: putative toxin-antitoxin system toxin component, PIN family [Elusimicrobia bacterium GWA2_38_7]OGR79409.1 MAG: putative toxin-antitoxin system toxin component, PIN family [Elusimicrobia bacterium RIFCSPHIGHO2_02_FULL_39_36]OGR92736.1 MAG: putative toxin-antitoxin system toxin component, PIN family [Elusimicrobia bacterium RIFCSPLOWO2_02_FULL_39_32]OGR99520.1 MAG: putative toxin-antitoxin system toxin component, PIN family [Elusimicrobia bacterium RIFCSPLOWO2_12_FULL_39_28]
MKVVLDTNVLVSGIFWRGTSRSILELWAREQLEVLVSPLILKEYERVIFEVESEKRTGLTEEWWKFIIHHSILIYPEETLHICRDPDDDKFLNCAVNAGARYLVSGDDDLLVLKEIYGIPILKPREFLNYKS